MMVVLRRTIQDLGCPPGECTLVYVNKAEKMNFWACRLPVRVATEYLSRIAFLRQPLEWVARVMAKE